MVITRGTGKPDYSINTFRTAPASKQDGQGRLYFNSTYTIEGSSGIALTPTTTPATGTKWVIYKLIITWDGDSLGKVSITDVDGNFMFATRWGYGSCEIDIPDGYEFGAGNKPRMTFNNYDNIAHNIYWYFLGMIEDVE